MTDASKTPGVVPHPDEGGGLRWTAADDAAHKAMLDEAPAHLFRYLSPEREDELRGTILHGLVRAGSPRKLNDPFDCRARLISHGTSPARIRAHWAAHFADDGRVMGAGDIDRVEELVNQSLDGSDEPALAQAIRASFDERAMLCFSERWDNILMWSHYARGHTGVCLRFNTQADGWEVPAMPMIFKLNYSSEFPVANCYQHSHFQQLRLLLGTKSKEWEYEQEWRMLWMQRPEAIRLKDGLLDGILLGVECDPELRRKILAWVSECSHPIEVVQLEGVPGKYALQQVVLLGE